MFGRLWSDAYAWGALGDTVQVCVALRQAVAAGLLIDLVALDRWPSVAEARKQPCFAQATAPARANAQAQVQAARKAGLL